MHVAALLATSDLFVATSLVRNETDGERGITMTLYQDRRFSGSESLRRNVLRYLRLRWTQTKRLRRFLDCGQNAWLQESSVTQRLRVICTTCRDRLCPVCQRAKLAITRRRLTAHLDDAWCDQWRMLTLTMKHSNAPLALQLKHLHGAFRRLRQRRLWKSSVRSGYVFLEVTFNRETRTWHPHLHALLCGHWMQQAALADQWEECTRGSRIVDIRKVRQKRQALKYLTKYLTKTADCDVTGQIDLLAEYDQAMRGQRTISPLGAARAVNAKPEAQSQDEFWVTLGQFDRLFSEAYEGNHVARQIIERWERQGAREQDDPTFEFQ